MTARRHHAEESRGRRAQIFALEKEEVQWCTMSAGDGSERVERDVVIICVANIDDGDLEFRLSRVAIIRCHDFCALVEVPAFH